MSKIKKHEPTIRRIRPRVPKLIDLRRVVNDLVAGRRKHGEAAKYNQNNWCGTACCVWGHVWAHTGHHVVASHQSNNVNIMNAMNFGRAQFLFSLPTELRRSLEGMFHSHKSKPSQFQKLLSKWPAQRVKKAIEDKRRPWEKEEVQR